MTTGLLFGCFDILHIGHLKYLRNAKLVCNNLIVGVNSDEIVKKQKGSYPIIEEEYRLKIIRAVKYINKAIINGNKSELIEYFKPDVIFVSEKAKNKKEYRKLAKKYKFIISYIPYTEEISSTKIKNRIINEKANSSKIKE